MRSFKPKQFLRYTLLCGALMFSANTFAATNPLTANEPTAVVPNYRSATPASEDGTRKPISVYSSNKIDVTAPPQGNFSQLLPCPNTPAFLNGNVNRYIKQPICPDINNKWPVNVTRQYEQYSNGDTESTKTETLTFQEDLNNVEYSSNPFLAMIQALGIAGQQLQCPDQCYVRRYVSTTTGSGGQTVINAYRPAVCPDGYAQVASFEMQDEVINNPSPIDLPFPVRSMETYYSYLEKGYDCSPEPQQDTDFVEDTCRTAVFTFGSGYTTPTVQFDNATATPVLLGSSSKGTAVVEFSYPRPSIYGLSGSGKNPHPGGNQCGCTTGGSYGCTLYCNAYYYDAYTTLRCSSGNTQPFSIKFRHPYRFMKCTIPAGLVYTDRSAPAARVCSRIAPSWSNQDTATGVTRQ